MRHVDEKSKTKKKPCRTQTWHNQILEITEYKTCCSTGCIKSKEEIIEKKRYYINVMNT